MRVFVTGASGWIGSAVVPALLNGGHDVVGLARSDASAAKVKGLGAEVLRGDIDDANTLRKGAGGSDGVIHLAFNHDVFSGDQSPVETFFAQFESAGRSERRAIETLGTALYGSDKPFVVASGTPAVPGRTATEHDDPIGVGPAAIRAESARAALAMAARGVRSSVVRLPRSVHGEGDAHGFIARLITIARERGASGYVGDGSSRWPAVHVSDAAQLFRLALENAPSGAVLHAVGDEGVPTHDIAAVIGRHLGLPLAPASPSELGFLGMLLAGDQPASSALTSDLLQWAPIQPGLLEDMNKGHYFL